MATTPTRPIRVDPALWEAFGEVTEAMGTDRTKVLVAFMRRFVDAWATQTAEGDHAAGRPHSAT